MHTFTHIVRGGWDGSRWREADEASGSKETPVRQREAGGSDSGRWESVTLDLYRINALSSSLTRLGIHSYYIHICGHHVGV